jgi:hypothetical protein
MPDKTVGIIYTFLDTHFATSPEISTDKGLGYRHIYCFSMN